MMVKPKVRVRRTPNCLHLYRATVRGRGSYGWGNTPGEAKIKLVQQIAKAEGIKAATVLTQVQL